MENPLIIENRKVKFKINQNNLWIKKHINLSYFIVWYKSLGNGNRFQSPHHMDIRRSISKI